MRSSPTHFILLLTGALAMACGSGHTSGGGDDDGTVDAGDGDRQPRPDARQPATLRGKVWAPNMGPHQAPSMQEIPIYGALVYASQAKPDPIPDGVFCEPCVTTPPGGVYSSHDGSFTLTLDPGTHWLVIQKAQFRIEQQITVKAGEQIDLNEGQTTLPSQHDPANGLWVPRMAIVMGSDDQIEDVLGKIGVGTINADGTLTASNGEVDLYDNGRLNSEVSAPPDGDVLLADLAQMKRYHIIFFACSQSELTLVGSSAAAVKARRNIREYVKLGGKIYVTDWSGEVMDYAFPPQVTLGDRGADSTGEYDPANPDVERNLRMGTSDGRRNPYTSPDAEATDENLAMWLGLQRSPTEFDKNNVDVINPKDIDVTHNFNWIRTVSAFRTGVDEDGKPIENTPKVWLQGSLDDTPVGKHPLSVTFEPTGCGRVLYSTYQTSNGKHVPLFPQERVLLYLIMEIGTCIETLPDVD